MPRLIDILKNKGRLLTTEFLPPKLPGLSDLVNKALRVADVIDSVSLPELKANLKSSPRSHMNPFYAAVRLRDLTGIETVFHLTPRDYNRNAITGLILAAAEARLQNLLIIGGDRYSRSEQELLSRNVYDISNSVQLITEIRSLEKELNLGNERFCLIAGTDPTVVYTRDRKRIEAEVTKLLHRQDAGAELIQTQPIFDERYFEFLDFARTSGLNIPVLAGILPLRGRVDAAAIERRYGIQIPLDVKSKMNDDDPDTGRRLALDLAQNLVRNGVRTLHVYPRESTQFLSDLAKHALSQESEDLD